MATLPSETREVRLHPDLADPLRAMIDPYRGEQLDAAQNAISQVCRDRTIQGTHRDLLERYARAIGEAVDEPWLDVILRVPGAEVSFAGREL